MRQLWAPWRMTYVGGDEPPPDGCVLCIADAGDDHDHRVVERAEHTFTLLNRFPYASGHVMVVPHRHVADITELDDAESAALLTGAARAVRALTQGVRAEGFNIGVNQGRVAGASLDHLHLHVVPRWEGDTNFMPVVADLKVLPQHLDETALELRAAYAQMSTR